MKENGTRLDGIEVGNAWEIRSTEHPQTNWLVGNFPMSRGSLRFMQQTNAQERVAGDMASDIAVKWFQHDADEPELWGINKPISVGRTLSILVGDGKFELLFTKDDYRYVLTLDRPGDFVIWGPGLGHSWRTIENCTILTVRWRPQ